MLTLLTLLRPLWQALEVDSRAGVDTVLLDYVDDAGMRAALARLGSGRLSVCQLGVKVDGTVRFEDTEWCVCSALQSRPQACGLAQAPSCVIQAGRSLRGVRVNWHR